MTELRSASPGERRKRQARESQRKSRARRRADVDVLRERVKALTQALETTTGACLQLNDVFASTADLNQNKSLARKTLQPFLAQVLSAARVLEQDEDTDEDISPRLDKDYQVMQSTEANSSVTITTPLPTVLAGSHRARPSRGIAINGAMSPRLNYGLWPNVHFPSLLPPSDIIMYLSSTEVSDLPFHIALYWNTLSHAYASLTHGTSLVYQELFRYMLLFSSRGDVIDRVRRRLHFRPAAVSLVSMNLRETPQSTANMHGQVSRPTNELDDIEDEASDLARNHSLIKQAMLQQGDTVDNYLDSVAVEQYLHTAWQITAFPATVASDGQPSSASLDVQLSFPAMQHMIRRLAQSSRCLGDRIGFPVHMIDTLALDYLYTPALP